MYIFCLIIIEGKRGSAKNIILIIIRVNDVLLNRAYEYKKKNVQRKQVNESVVRYFREQI